MLKPWNLLGAPLIWMSLPSWPLIIIHTSHIWPTNKSWILWSTVWGWCCTWVFGNGICNQSPWHLTAFFPKCLWPVLYHLLSLPYKDPLGKHWPYSSYRLLFTDHWVKPQIFTFPLWTIKTEKPVVNNKIHRGMWSRLIQNSKNLKSAYFYYTFQQIIFSKVVAILLSHTVF